MAEIPTMNSEGPAQSDAAGVNEKSVQHYRCRYISITLHVHHEMFPTCGLLFSICSLKSRGREGT